MNSCPVCRGFIAEGRCISCGIVWFAPRVYTQKEERVGIVEALTKSADEFSELAWNALGAQGGIAEIENSDLELMLRVLERARGEVNRIQEAKALTAGVEKFSHDVARATCANELEIAISKLGKSPTGDDFAALERLCARWREP